MGEAKRRKLLDPTFGQTRYLALTLDGKDIELTSCIIEGTFKHRGTGQDLEIDLSSNCTEDEGIFLVHMLTCVIQVALEKYNYADVFYKVRLDLSKFLQNLSGKIVIYPLYWDFESPMLRDYREIEFSLREKVKQDNSTAQRSSPKTHIRRAHKKRVACGKGRSERKWIDIPETTVADKN